MQTFTPPPELWLTIRSLLALVFTLAFMLVLAWAARRYGGRLGMPATAGERARHRLQLLESKRLNQHLTLHLVQLDDTEHLLASTATSTSLITTNPTGKGKKK
jgi:flagellar biogenesis protein FliO